MSVAAAILNFCP